jgi:tetratricopeptide (TPR) repeat protein
MGRADGDGRSGKRKRRVIALVVFVAALVALGFAISRLQRRAPSGETDRARLDLLQAAWEEFAAQRYEKAVEFLDRRATAVSPTPLDWMLRARIAESQNRFAEALDHLKQIPDSDSISAQASLKAGQIELARHRARAAEAAYVRSLKLNPDQIQPHRELAYLFALERRKAECDAQFQILSRLMSMDYVLAFPWCQNYCGIWDPNESGKVLARFVEADPGDRWSRLALATSYQMKNQADQAEAVLAPLGDSDPDARALRLQIAIERGEVAAAHELALAGPADHPRLNLLRGQLAIHDNDPRKAAALFRLTLRHDAEDRDAIHGLGIALRQLGDPAAAKWFERAARHDKLKRLILDSVSTFKTDRKLFCKLGLLCEELNRHQEARVWYQIAIQRDPLDTEAQQGLARLLTPAPDATPSQPRIETDKASAPSSFFGRGQSSSAA